MKNTTMTLIDEARQLQDEIVNMRRRIHARPELSFQEKETAALASSQLCQLGFEIREGVGGTGVVAELGKGERTIAIRADMDGLPIQETNQAPYKSQNAGVMHACGHDAHVSCALAAAKLLSRQKLDGKIRMLMQPAEENCDAQGKSGARRMIEDGAMDGVDAVIGLHVDSSLPAGKVAIQGGAVMAAADMFRIVITGKGGHGAYPETTIDSVVIAAQVIQALQQVVSRRISPVEPVVVTIGSIKSSSSRGNVISESVELAGTIRSFSMETRKKALEEVERACSVAKALGANYRLDYEMGYPATVNDPGTAGIMRAAACDLIGADNIITIPPKTWGEDFSMLAEVAPGAFMFLGGEVAGDRRSHHSPNFDIDESGLYIGSAILAETARRLLKA